MPLSGVVFLHMPKKNSPQNGYVHGYSARESERLTDQAQTLTDLLHHDTHYPAGSRVSKPAAVSVPRR